MQMAGLTPIGQGTLANHVINIQTNLQVQTVLQVSLDKEKQTLVQCLRAQPSPAAPGYLFSVVIANVNIADIFCC